MKRLTAVAVCAAALAACTSPRPAAHTRNEAADQEKPPATAVCWSAPVTPGRGPLAFADTTAQDGLLEPLLGVYGHAAALGDVNADGWADLFVGTFADRAAETYRLRGADGPAPDRLLLGGRDRFSVDAGFPSQRSRSSGAAFADLDGDGDLDLIVARNTPTRGAPRETVAVENDGTGPRRVHVLVPDLGARSIGVLDFDADGRLDLFLTEDRFSGGSSVLLRHEGRFRFTDVTAPAGIGADVHGLGVTVADLTADGLPDLFVSGSNRLFVNAGDGRFREAESPMLRWETYGPEDDVAGVAAADLNRDGRPDLVVGQHFNSTLDFNRQVPVRVYLHDGLDASGLPRFRDVTVAARVPAFPTKAPHVEMVDFDNDGWPDILTTASARQGSWPAVLRHEGLRNGVPVFATPEGIGDRQYWVTGGTPDVDHDGRLDVLLVEFDPGRPTLLLRNQSPGGHWLSIEVGPAGASGVGVVVAAYRAGRAGQPQGLLGVREIGATVGYGAGALPVAHFGLGAEAVVDLVISPPRGTSPIRIDGVAADRHLRLDAAGALACNP